MDPNRLHHTLPSNISSSSINGGSTNKNNLLSVNNTSGSSLGRSGLLHATSNGSWASSGNHRYPIDLIYSLDILTFYNVNISFKDINRYTILFSAICRMDQENLDGFAHKLCF